VIPEPFSRRATLLRYNAGAWEGTFIRLDATGLEVERFPSSLEVQERDALVVASLTNGRTGSVRTMEFAEPPAEMQIQPQGHWSLGPDRIGPWPWVSELCLVHGDRRRRVVVRHGSDGIESVVLVSEGRPGQGDPPPPQPHRATMLPPAGAGQALWLLECTASSRLELALMAQRSWGTPQAVRLRWWPDGEFPGAASRPTPLEIGRCHAASGLLEPWP
jgi:hypothetical protein